MNNKITIYELLGLVKDEQAPKRIKVDDEIYEYRDVCIDYIQPKIKNSNYWLFKDYLFGSNGNRLNEEVEILDNEDEDIEEINKMAFVYHVEDEKQNANNDRFKDFINILIDEVNKLKKGNHE